MIDNAKVAVVAFIAGAALAGIATSGRNDAPAMPQPVPAGVTEKFNRVLRVPVTGDNQCFVTVASKSHTWRALIDTGADGVYLDHNTAQLLGFDPSRLAFGHRVRGATGEDRGASVLLPDLNISGFRLRNVEASVQYGDTLDYPLIGMSVLKSLGRFEVARGNCSLMW